MQLQAEIARLLEPIEEGNPCGQSLDDTQALAALEAYRVFGRIKAAADEPNWRELRKACLDALTRSKDLRVLAHLAAAALRTDALTDALRVLALAGAWLEQYWDGVFPRIDEDAIARRNALNFFADRLGVVDALRRVPIVKDVQLGAFSVRDLELATGALAPAESDSKSVSVDAINSALAATDKHSLHELSELVLAAINALRRVEAAMLERGGGSEAVPKLDSLVRVLQQMEQMLAPYAATPAEQVSQAGDVDPPRQQGVGIIESRQDVLRSLDAVMQYYRTHEPGSLVPMITERAKRMVTMSFLEALAEIAPEALDPVKKAVGVREQPA